MWGAPAVAGGSPLPPPPSPPPPICQYAQIYRALHRKKRRRYIYFKKIEWYPFSPRTPWGCQPREGAYDTYKSSVSSARRLTFYNHDPARFSYPGHSSHPPKTTYHLSCLQEKTGCRSLSLSPLTDTLVYNCPYYDQHQRHAPHCHHQPARRPSRARNWGCRNSTISNGRSRSVTCFVLF